MSDDLRDYGLGSSGTPIGIPKASTPKEPSTCPNCGCKEVMEINIEMANPRLRGGKGTGTYFGCPACPWASPCLVITLGKNSGG